MNAIRLAKAIVKVVKEEQKISEIEMTKTLVDLEVKKILFVESMREKFALIRANAEQAVWVARHPRTNKSKN